MSLIVVDVEADGPIPSEYSMVSFGAVLVDNSLNKTFYGEVKPISDKWIPSALNVSKISREQHLMYDDPIIVMKNFADWLKINSKGNPVFISDNNGFDWQWINYYFHKYYGSNPFGFSSRRIGDIYCGMKLDMKLNNEWKKKYRKTKHSHFAIDDATGNAEAILAFEKLGLKL